MTNDIDRRYSTGGRVFHESLLSVGDAPMTARVHLVETSISRARPLTMVAQNAWNFIPRAEFRRLAHMYPPPMLPRIRARRALAYANCHRAQTIVTATEYMNTLVQRISADSVAAPLTLPIDPEFLQAASVHSSRERPYVLVPGTLTWYKRPWLAIEKSDLLRLKGQPVFVFAGADDRSGCWEHTLGVARAHNMQAFRTQLTRAEMRRAIIDADAVILPSELESLGFSLAESVMLAKRLFASSIPAHIETVQRMQLASEVIDENFLECQVLDTEAERRLIIAQATEHWVALSQLLSSPQRPHPAVARE